jgi:hypothetical protein
LKLYSEFSDAWDYKEPVRYRFAIQRPWCACLG